MPKLPTRDAARVEKATAVIGGDYELLKAGHYLARLRSVEARSSTNGHPQWSVRWEQIHDLEHNRFPGIQFQDLNLPQATMPPSYEKGEEKWGKYQAMCEGQLKAFFEGLGYTADSDTDEMIGEWAIIHVGVQTIARGPKQGEKRNVVQGVVEIPADMEIPEVDEEDDDGGF